VNLDAEWSALVMTAVLGTERRSPPEPPAELAAWSTATDPAVAVLDRAAALVTARRAGARPLPPADRLRPPAVDPRPACPGAAARVLARLLWRNERELIGEWLARLDSGGWRLPPEHAPALLARARGDVALEPAARAAAGPLADWLDEVLGPPGPQGRSAAPVPVPAAPLDAEAEGDLVEAVLARFHRGGAGEQRATLRATVLTLDPSRLEHLAAALAAVTGQPLTAALRHELADLARLRAAVARSFPAA
jgi:hypothetical protein